MTHSQPVQTPLLASGIRDNHTRGSVGDFLTTHIAPGASLSFVSAYFTIHAFGALKDTLLPIERLRFLYGEPRGIATLDPDKILDLYRTTCAERATPDDALCRLFDQRTQDGLDMSHETMLLEKAVQSLAQTFKKRAASLLLSGHGARLPAVQEQVHELTDFELVTWLVLVKPEGET